MLIVHPSCIIRGQVIRDFKVFRDPYVIESIYVDLSEAQQAAIGVYDTNCLIVTREDALAWFDNKSSGMLVDLQNMYNKNQYDHDLMESYSALLRGMADDRKRLVDLDDVYTHIILLDEDLPNAMRTRRERELSQEAQSHNWDCCCNSCDELRMRKLQEKYS